MKNEQWGHTRFPRAALFFIVVSYHRARAEALRRCPCHSVARHHLFLSERRALSPQEEKEKPFWLLFLSCLSLAPIAPFWLLCCPIACALRRWEGALAVATRTPSSFLGWEKGTLSSGGKKNHFDCCFFLVFPWLRARWGAAKVPALHRVVWLCLGTAGCWCSMSCFLVIARPHWKKKEGFFSRWGSFLLSPAGMHIRNCPPASARAGDEPAKAYVSCWVFVGGGSRWGSWCWRNDMFRLKILRCQGVLVCKGTIYLL